MSQRMLVFGTVGIDSFYRIGTLPAEGESCFDGEYRIDPGGSGLISALTMRAFGFETYLASRTGDDGNAEEVRAFLRDEDIGTRFISSDPLRPTSHTVYLTEKEGKTREMRRMVFREAIDNLSISSARDAFRCQPDAVFLQLDVPADAAAAVMEEAEERGIPVFLNPGHCDGGCDYSALEGFTAEIFTPDEEETFRLTGSALRSQDDCMRACIQLSRIVKAHYYVLKLGERGSFLYDGLYCRFVTPYEVGVTDRVGVGEIFSSILAAEYLRSGGRIEKSMEFANAGAAISLTRAGGHRSVPKYSEVVSVVSDNME